MEDNKVLILDDVSVRYRKHDSRTAADIIKRIVGVSEKNNEFWALKHISFSLEKGDMLGVVGKNGAGKSTLMKAISGTLAPAAGTIEKEGKLNALLELGAGFDKEMTVKENVYLRGALLGYSREFIDSKYDEIIDFAEMREFEDNPFRTLSSGMKSRIAFAIASIVDPDIIILDEVFAVGDGDFKKKSRKRMQSILDAGNCTALMVSHSIDTVRKQCNKVLWLNKGKMIMFGDPNEVCDAYEKFLETGKLPKVETHDTVDTKPLKRKKTSKRKKLKGFAIGIALFLFAAAGSFVWSQYDMVDAYFTAKHTKPDELLDEAQNYHDSIFKAMGVNSYGWNKKLITPHIDDVAAGKLTYREVARDVLSAAGIDGSQEDYPLRLAAAEIEVVKAVNISELDRIIAETREEFKVQPIGKYRSLIVYSYFHADRFYSLEDDCDKQMQDIVEDIRSYLRSNGLDENMADKVWNLYQKEKGELLSYYCIRLR